jgi:hypothetical protein
MAFSERPPASNKQRPQLGFSFELVIWAAFVAFSAWMAIDGSLFFAFFGLFGCYRLASAAALYSLGNASIGQSRRGTVAVWLLVGRTAATGVLVTGGSVVAMILHPHAVAIILGSCGILAGQAALIGGIQLLAKLRRESLRLRDPS